MSKKKITFLGDIMCSIPESAVSKAANGSFDYTHAFGKIKNYLSKSDYVIGNLETPIAGHELNYTSETTLFNTPVEFVQALKCAGVDMVTTANNHALDRGLFGLERTIDNLKSVPMEFTGTRKSSEDEAYLIKDFNGFKVAFISYTYGADSDYRNNALLKDEEYHLNFYRTQDEFPVISKTSRAKEFLKLVVPEFIKKMGRDSTYIDCGMVGDEKCNHFDDMIALIQEAKKHSDYVVMCIHIGGQYNDDIGDYTQLIIDRCIKAGCDSVIGNHPHCVLKSMNKTNGFVAYALGNFFCTPHWGYYLDGKYADYSIILNLCFDVEKKQIEEITYSVAKSILVDGRSVVRLVNDLYENATLKERKKIEKDLVAVINRFTGRKIKKIIVKEEYKY